MRLKELDVLRGIAALSVVFFHYTTKFRQEFGHHYSKNFDWPYGYYGVQLFFVISGFVIFLTLHQVKTTGEFFYKRFTRLYPTYWLCLILSFIALQIWPVPGREVSLKEAVIGLTMFQELFHTKHVDGAYWSLLPELLFYGIMGCMFYFKLLDRIKLMGIVWMLLIFINRIHQIPYLNVLLVLNFGMYFFAGIIFYKIKFDKPVFDNHIYTGCCYALAIWANFNIPAIIIITTIFILFYLFAYNKLSFLFNKPLYFTGLVSYPLYLIHQNIGFAIIRFLNMQESFEWLNILIALSIVITLSSLITFYYEKPLLLFLRKRKYSTKVLFVSKLSPEKE